MSDTRIRSLIIAEQCNPEWVSVPLVGWLHARAIAKLTDSHLVTQIRNRPEMVRAGLVEGRDFTAIDTEPLFRPIYWLADRIRGGAGKGWTTVTALSSLAYPYFEHLVWKRFGREIMDRRFDVVHRITPLSPTSASSLATRCHEAGVPFVMGPLNGGVPWPKGFDSARLKEREWLSYVRDVYKLVPGFSATRRHSAAILIASADTWDQMPASFHGKCFYLPENAIEPANFAARRTRQAQRPIKVMFLGRLVPYKGADMLLEAALPLLRTGALTIEVIGDGPQRSELEQFIQQEGIERGVNLVGWVEHKMIQHRLADADVFAFPSVREFGGAVALEAMAVGLVPIVMAYGGPGELVTPETGYLLPMESREKIIAKLRDLLGHLAEHPEELDAKSPAAWERAHGQFTWDAKARAVVKVYEYLLGRGSKPAMPPPMRNVGR